MVLSAVSVLNDNVFGPIRTTEPVGKPLAQNGFREELHYAYHISRVRADGGCVDSRQCTERSEAN